MADTTIVNTPGSGSGDSGAGWMVAVIILIAVVAGGFLWYRYQGRAVPADTNINVTIPTGTATGGAAQ